MKKTILSFCAGIGLGLIGTTAFAQNYKLEKTIAIPGEGGYDYAFIDQQNHRLYTSHGTAVNVIDLETEQVISTISGMKGVHGIAVVDDLNRGFISDGKGSAAVAFDTKTNQVIKTIPLSGSDADGIIYDPFSKKIFVFEGDANAAVVVDPVEMKEVASINVGGAPEFAASDGNGHIYNNLEDKSSMDVIDTKTLKVTRTWSLSPCGGPTGLALDMQNNRAFSVCRQNKGMSVVDITSGKVVQTLPIGSGVDAVIYDPVNKLVIASNGDGTASVYKQDSPDSYSLVQTLKTQYRAKTMAMDQTTHKLYFPVADYQQGTRNIVPGSFKVLVYRLE